MAEKKEGLGEAAVGPAAKPEIPGRYDFAARRRGVRKGREKGCWVYIPAVELAAAGIPPDLDGTPWYRTRGHARSANAATVIVDLYREP
jgi:hypothetical protein